jgi:hypothetical protein
VRRAASGTSFRAADDKLFVGRALFESGSGPSLIIPIDERTWSANKPFGNVPVVVDQGSLRIPSAALKVLPGQYDDRFPARLMMPQTEGGTMLSTSPRWCSSLPAVKPELALLSGYVPD